MSRATVAIIGGGFCGTLAAIRLLSGPLGGRTSLPFGSRIVLIDPARPGQGLAYRPGPDYWRLNVPAARMSALSERPADFLSWARTRNPAVQADEFLPRSWYGDYLATRLEEARRRSAGWMKFQHVAARAIDIRIDNGGAQIRLTDNSTIEAEKVLLALGNSPSASAVPGIAASDTIPDAWNPDWITRLPASPPRVLLIGTGLTMIDIALHIAAIRPDAHMLAVSRHGLLPLPQDSQPLAGKSAPFAAETRLARGSLHQRLRAFRQFVESWTDAGGDWRVALQTVREAMPALWHPLPRALRARFLRHLRTWWDVHRHRVPRATLWRINDLRRDDRMRIEAGRLLGTRRLGSSIEVSWRRRGSEQVLKESVDALVNVTGADGDPRRSNCPLVRSLLTQGLCQPDELGLGWGTDDDGRLLAADTAPSQVLHYAGPFLRAHLFEATAVPELRVYVDRTVDALVSSLQLVPGRRIAGSQSLRCRNRQATNWCRG